MPERNREKLLRNLRSGVEGARALAADCYRDPEFFALEVEHLLRRGDCAGETVADDDHVDGLVETLDGTRVGRCGHVARRTRRR